MKTNQSIKLLSSTTSDYSPDVVLWFATGMKEEVQIVITSLESGIASPVRVGIDCSVFNTEIGELWYDWLMSALGKKFDLELCFDKFCPHLCSKESVQKYSLSEIVGFFIFKYGEQFKRVELWKNPRDKFIPITSSTNIFSDELILAASRAFFTEKNVTIGGIQIGDFEWFSLLVNSGFLIKVDAIRLDSEGDLWSTNTPFFAETIRSILKVRGFNTQVLSNPKSLLLDSV